MQDEYTLGISFSSRMLGLAILNHFTLVDHRSKLYKEKWSTAKADMMIADLASCMEYYNITLIILSIPSAHYHTNEHISLYQRILQLAYEYKITIEEIATKDIKLLCTHAPKKTKRSQMEVLSRLYAELQPYFEKEVRNKSRYYEKMFDALGVVLIHTHRKQESRG